jgi:7,8-dihydropterin-6-yl-methyl-4-(beta-D-ribofuranosyl)aminobenzene 5'-phosphate synthase
MIINEVDRVEILTLQDNYVDLVVMDNTPVIQRARPLKDGELKSSIMAEHGFSAVVTVQSGEEVRSALFDFGFSEHGAALNAETLDEDMSRVEVCALSHGHPDHVGGLKKLAEKVGKRGIHLVLHPAAFTTPR